MSSTLIKAGALALACASTVSATLKYTLAPGDNYEGGNFFEKFDFKAVRDNALMMDVSDIYRSLIQPPVMSNTRANNPPSRTLSERLW